MQISINDNNVKYDWSDEYKIQLISILYIVGA
jgi:hypothetical protein